MRKFKKVGKMLMDLPDTTVKMEQDIDGDDGDERKAKVEELSQYEDPDELEDKWTMKQQQGESEGAYLVKVQHSPKVFNTQ